jgi:hypothetical protein
LLVSIFVHAQALHSKGDSGMKSNFGEPVGTRYLPEQLKLIEEAAAALKIQRCEIIRIGAAVYAKQVLGKISGH